MSYYLIVTESGVTLRTGRLTLSQFKLGMIEHHGDAKSIRWERGIFWVRVDGELVKKRTLGSARRLAGRRSSTGELRVGGGVMARSLDEMIRKDGHEVRRG